MDAGEMKLLARRHGVSTETIQRDYSATVLLSVISEFREISEMVFKGGTAIKKIYFPDGRFSEDLDFTCGSGIQNELGSLLKRRLANSTWILLKSKEWKRENTAKNTLSST